MILTHSASCNPTWQSTTRVFLCGNHGGVVKFYWGGIDLQNHQNQAIHITYFKNSAVPWHVSLCGGGGGNQKKSLLVFYVMVVCWCKICVSLTATPLTASYISRGGFGSQTGHVKNIKVALFPVFFPLCSLWVTGPGQPRTKRPMWRSLKCHNGQTPMYISDAVHSSHHYRSSFYLFIVTR